MTSIRKTKKALKREIRRIGIAWEMAGFCTWFSGDIGSPVINRDDMTMTDNFTPHFKL